MKTISKLRQRQSIVVALFLTILLVGCQTDQSAQQQADQLVDQLLEEELPREEESSPQAAADPLSSSPRHHERVEVENNGKTIYTWVVYPQTDQPAPVVVVIHENKGLTDRVRTMADQIAAEGYIAVAPDLLSNFSEEQDRTSDFATEDEATQALYQLDDAEVMDDLQAVASYAEQLDASNGKVASAGFCRGGSQSFRYAMVDSGLELAFVFYGTAPEEGELYEQIEAPIVAFYGGDDERVNATIPQTEAYMQQFEQTYQYEIYTGAGHAFMRRAVQPDAEVANVQAREQAFDRMLSELASLK